MEVASQYGSEVVDVGYLFARQLVSSDLDLLKTGY
jgi:hypothetical protein